MKLNIKSLFSHKITKKTLSRLSIGIVAVGIVAVLILWDSGVIDLPFLTRKPRKDTPLSQTVTGEGIVQEIEIFDYSAYAASILNATYDLSAVEGLKERITAADFDPETMSFVKTSLRLEQKIDSLYHGILEVHDENGSSLCLTTPDLDLILSDLGLTFTHYTDAESNPIFFKNETEQYYILSPENNTLEPIKSSLDREIRLTQFSLPDGYLTEEKDHKRIEENGLFGYEGSYKDGWRTRRFKVDPQYPVAFRYAEGFAVMADENGVVTIRNERGEIVFGEHHLLLPEETGSVSDLGFTRFDHGCLRVVFANYDENGNLLSKREGILKSNGEELILPEGFRAVSYLDGVFVVTDGNRYGYYTSDNAWIGNPVYSDAAPFSEGLAVVTDSGGKQGLIDRNGNEVLPTTFDSVSTVSEASFLVYDEISGWYLFTKVNGIYEKEGEVVPPASSFYTKITITRSPNNTFYDTEEDIIIELSTITSTSSYTTHPEIT